MPRCSTNWDRSTPDPPPPHLCHDAGVDDDAAGELTALRARAYGPTADIGMDAAARARLAELEARERAVRMPVTPAPVPPPLPTPEPTVPRVGARRSDDAAPPSTTTTTHITAPEPTTQLPDRTRRVLWGTAWVGSLAAVATVVAVVATAASAQFAWPATSMADDGVTFVTHLAVDPDVDVPTNYYGGEDDTVVYEAIAGLTPFTFTYDYEGGVNICVIAVPSQHIEEPEFASTSAQGCSTGAFPAAAALLVTEDAPPVLQQRFPIGTSLQFVLQGDGIDVFSAPPPPPAET